MTHLLTAIADGTLRIRNTRIPLETVIGRYLMGDTPEQIHSGFPTLSLADIETVIAHYHANREQVTAYMQAQADAGERIREKVEASQPQARVLRERLRGLLADETLLARDWDTPDEDEAWKNL